MPDASHWFGSDLAPSPTGDLGLVDGIDLGNQRIVRRLMTILQDYVWHPEYGASVPIRIGDTLDIDVVTAVIRSQIFLEAVVSRVPEPKITIEPILNGVFVSIAYIDALTGEQASLQFDLAR